MKRFKAQGKAVLVVEYLCGARSPASAATEIRSHGFVPNFAQRNL